MTVRLLSRFIRTGCVQGGKDQYMRGTISKGRGTFCKAAGRSDQTSCVPAWHKSSESLRIPALEKYPKEKSMIRSNKEARSSAQSLVHALVELVGTFAGRSGTRPDQSVWYGRKSEPRLDV
ncbi:hypothetical protein F2Q70_00021913 [Brassica cretica]|uniref:Uncharacterized protein n=1 Tax=Brassica cretica TaxID=69181 RepID=A0A8S9HKL7_BRACR|nr:hypothetical protein F2Q70_00021913 [Brassica cretica]KAF2556078.1 hypothetical protein F2Q68_00015691 [Brassica cretica]